MIEFRELVKDKSYPYIEYRGLWNFKKKKSKEEKILDEFLGVCKSENGNIISLDGDIYHESELIYKYEEWYAKEDYFKEELINGAKTDIKIVNRGDLCLTVWKKIDIYTK